VILVDANLLIYAHSSNFPQHVAAREWLDEQINGLAQVGLPWPCLLAFLRITTNPRMFARPNPMAKAWEQVSAWLACEPVWTPGPTERHAGVLAALLAQQGVRGDLVSDAHLAALAIEHGLTLCSADNDFSRFANLRWLNPLV
jgi:toxin-antitoxin system PIN domain toxin